MGHEPQPVANAIANPRYRPEAPLLELAPWLADPVAPADFPAAELRWRNDRWAAPVGLDQLSDAEWVRHFARFDPLPGTLPQPLALRYHGHQFRVYNPEIGDGSSPRHSSSPVSTIENVLLVFTPSASSISVASSSRTAPFSVSRPSAVRL